MARLLVVDDEVDLAEMVARALRQDGHEVAIVHSGPEALKMVRQFRPDLMVLDILMPQMDGLEVCQRIRSDPSMADLPILFLTARGSVEHRLEGFRAGADDYLGKPFDIRELAMRVRAVLRRSIPAMPQKLEVGPLTLDCQTFHVHVNGERHLLTPVEFELMYHLMSHPGEVFSSERLLQEVWRYPPGTGSRDLVRVHIRNLRAKIEPMPGQPIYIRTIGRHGYTIRPDEGDGGSEGTEPGSQQSKSTRTDSPEM